MLTASSFTASFRSPSCISAARLVHLVTQLDHLVAQLVAGGGTGSAGWTCRAGSWQRFGRAG